MDCLMPADKSICDLMEEFRPIIESLIDRSSQKNREHGFLVCRENDNLSIASVCEGDECHIEKLEGCEGKDVGLFHTHLHVTTMPEMSGMDVTYSIKCDHDFSCVGARRGVKCWSFDKSHPQYQEIKRRQGTIGEDRLKFNNAIALYNKDLEAWEAGDVEVEKRVLLAMSADIKRWRRRSEINESRLNSDARKAYPVFTKECVMREIV